MCRLECIIRDGFFYPKKGFSLRNALLLKKNRKIRTSV